MPVISFKVSEAEAREIRRRAKRERVTLSAYLRKRATEDAIPAASAGPMFKTCPVTGVKILAANPDVPAPTVEEVREMMNDFP